MRERPSPASGRRRPDAGLTAARRPEAGPPATAGRRSPPRRQAGLAAADGSRTRSCRLSGSERTRRAPPRRRLRRSGPRRPASAPPQPRTQPAATFPAVCSAPRSSLACAAQGRRRHRRRRKQPKRPTARASGPRGGRRPLASRIQSRPGKRQGPRRDAARRCRVLPRHASPRSRRQTPQLVHRALACLRPLWSLVLSPRPPPPRGAGPAARLIARQRRFSRGEPSRSDQLLA
mmetsp:Transcript_11604/g.45109  ORF Transcript_11604/g.45109 Transcript_11604/m.45109 type:complete len:233 (-) Transcript_11604:1099-1797(-)